MPVISDIPGAMTLDEAQQLAGEIAEICPHKLEICQYHGHRWDYGPLKETDPYRVIIQVPHPVHRYVYQYCNTPEQWAEYWRDEYLEAARQAALPKQGALL